MKCVVKPALQNDAGQASHETRKGQPQSDSNRRAPLAIRKGSDVAHDGLVLADFRDSYVGVLRCRDKNRT